VWIMGAAVTGEAVVGTRVTGASVVGEAVTGALVVGEAVTGASVVGACVIGLNVVVLVLVVGVAVVVPSPLWVQLHCPMMEGRTPRQKSGGTEPTIPASSMSRHVTGWS